MNANAYCIISETTEDRFDEVDNLEEAIRIARAVAPKARLAIRCLSSIGAGSFANWYSCRMGGFRRRKSADVRPRLLKGATPC